MPAVGRNAGASEGVTKKKFNSQEPDFIDMETPILPSGGQVLDEAQLVVILGCLRYSSLQTLSAKAPNRAA